jgi:hypothetical protein
LTKATVQITTETNRGDHIKVALNDEVV